ncbi:MAG TPA: hypothetical protein VHL11_13425, partial [Phototrophicaceae bacterium]|nr:hypothetical protein [Phototrophicaceae bacterium]
MSDMDYRDRGDRDRDRDSDDSFDGGDDRGGFRRQRPGRGRHTQYCPEGKCFDYKNVDALKRFIGETGKI